MNLPFSKVRLVGDQVWLSGVIGFEEDGSLAAEVSRQTDRVMHTIQATLAEQGCTLADIFSCTVYLTDADLFAPFNLAYAKWFSDPLPVRTTVLAGLVLQEALLEITVVAQKPTAE
ncbi:RidA family protein [Pantoea cypripedii]|jgi:2-iminobutanoate/2-iminopropanoate deaminase|uniref:RidA family protein n=1 Tax=Pantoea cypripedii TaxID=55209 RepID=A0A6B9G249_PANCY|nr:RidA family protein [Pantoea cypripedii]QGY29193.1 RidA family protein [Pantoea cypripedii]